jgi:hypothetical protein
LLPYFGDDSDLNCPTFQINHAETSFQNKKGRRQKNRIAQKRGDQEVFPKKKERLA